MKAEYDSTFELFMKNKWKYSLYLQMIREIPLKRQIKFISFVFMILIQVSVENVKHLCLEVVCLS